MLCPPQPLRFWITPACAGKRSQPFRSHFREKDHPRVCGEKCPPGKFFFMTVGSPPRVRGKVSAGKILLHDGGITPACAGKSWLQKRAPSTVWDHPRVCGEKFALPVNAILKPGSPPRMRGKALVNLFDVAAFGSTPACAGKRARPSPCRSQSRDHPRVCGEKTKPVPAGGILMGSPPRMRGKAVPVAAVPVAAGIIPAYAGKR